MQWWQTISAACMLEQLIQQPGSVFIWIYLMRQQTVWRSIGFHFPRCHENAGWAHLPTRLVAGRGFLVVSRARMGKVQISSANLGLPQNEFNTESPWPSIAETRLSKEAHKATWRCSGPNRSPHPWHSRKSAWFLMMSALIMLLDTELWQVIQSCKAKHLKNPSKKPQQKSRKSR